MTTTSERWRPTIIGSSYIARPDLVRFAVSLKFLNLRPIHHPQGNQKAMFSNPIIPGFAPDPSVVLVDGIYYLATSSFHLFPGIPIYASTNLQDWRHIGSSASSHCSGMSAG